VSPRRRDREIADRAIGKRINRVAVLLDPQMLGGRAALVIRLNRYAFSNGFPLAPFPAA